MRRGVPERLQSYIEDRLNRHKKKDRRRLALATLIRTT